METNKQNEIRNAYEHSAQVQCIPASIKKTTEHSEEDPLVVAPYCRVSTDNKDQLASYELQCQYYKEYVSKHPGWRLYDIYADEGISGTSVKKRTDFLRMIDDCKAGKIDIALTTAVHELIEYLRYQDIQALDEEEFLLRVRELIRVEQDEHFPF